MQRHFTSPATPMWASVYTYGPTYRWNPALTIEGLADALGLTPAERRLLLMDPNGRITNLLPKAEAKLREKGRWPPAGTEEAAMPAAPAPATTGAGDLTTLLAELDAALRAGGEDGMMAQFRAQLGSPAAREAYLSVLDV